MVSPHISAYVYLTLIILTQLLSHANSTRLPTSASELILKKPSSTRIDSPQSSINDAASPPDSNKFILLTNGDQIKLYPFILNDTAADDSRYFVVEPKSFNLSYFNYLGHNKLSEYLKSQLDKQHKSKRPKTILPYEAESYQNVDWKKPWITQVDYFFDPNYCGQQHEYHRHQPPKFTDPSASIDLAPSPSPSVQLNFEESCLVIIWFDERNKFIRYGSLDLMNNSILFTSNSHKSTNLNRLRNRILSLNEFPPIDLGKVTSPLSAKNVSVNSIVMNRKSKRLNIVINYKDQYTNNSIESVIVGKFNPVRYILERNEIIYSSEFLMINTLKFNQCQTTPNFISSIGNLQLDQKSSNLNNNLMFYFDKNQGGSVFVINMKTLKTGELVLKHSLLIDLFSSNKTIKTLGMALDSNRKSIYWLNNFNELYRCNYLGENTELVAKLPSKPSIKVPFEMMVYQDTLMLSDSFKKSLILYKLPATDRQIKAPEVILVEMPSLYGFKIIELTKSSRNKLNQISPMVSFDDHNPNYDKLVEHFNENDDHLNNLSIECKYDLVEYERELKSEAQLAFKYFILNLIIFVVGVPILVYIATLVFKKHKLFGWYRKEQSMLIDDKSSSKLQF